MNRVLEYENKEKNIQIYRSAQKMSTEAKLAKIIMYIVTFIPLILVLTQDLFGKDEATANLVKFSSSAVSLILNILTELISNIIANHKEKSVLLAQLFETKITSHALSKMEYDREMTNDIYELAIRKGTLKKEKEYTGAYDVPQEIDDKFAFLFINRYIAAETRYLLNKLQILYGILITVASILFIFLISNLNMTEAVYYIVCFWPVLIPIVRNFAKSFKNQKQCVKMSADIDNYFADGDDSSEKLNRFNAYIQSISFEMRNNLIIIPSALRQLLANQIKILDVGVTNRFIEAIYEFEYLVAQKKGIKTRKKTFEWISRNDNGRNVSASEKAEIIKKAQQNDSDKIKIETRLNSRVKLNENIAATAIDGSSVTARKPATASKQNASKAASPNTRNKQSAKSRPKSIGNSNGNASKNKK